MNSTQSRMGMMAFGLALAACTGQGDIDDVGSVSEASTSRHQSIQDGISASAYGGDGWSSWRLDAWENGIGATRTAYLAYYASTVDPTSEVCVTEEFPPRCPPEDPMCCMPGDPFCGGSYTYCYYTRWSYESAYGEIPSSAFQVTRNAARLRTQLAAGAGIYYERCTYDRLAGTGECTSGAGADLDVQWTRDGGYSVFNQGISEYQSGPYAYRTNGRSTQSSAAVSGSVAGQDVPAGFAWGWISEGRSIVREVFRL